MRAETEMRVVPNPLVPHLQANACVGFAGAYPVPGKIKRCLNTLRCRRFARSCRGNHNDHQWEHPRKPPMPDAQSLLQARLLMNCSVTEPGVLTTTPTQDGSRPHGRGIGIRSGAGSVCGPPPDVAMDAQTGSTRSDTQPNSEYRPRIGVALCIYRGYTRASNQNV
jgi:hypothetical protein